MVKTPGLGGILKQAFLEMRPLVDLNKQTPTAKSQSLLECGYFLAGDNTNRRPEIKIFQLLKCIVRHSSAAGCSAVDSIIMHQHKHTVASHGNIQLYNIHPHVDTSPYSTQ